MYFVGMSLSTGRNLREKDASIISMISYVKEHLMSHRAFQENCSWDRSGQVLTASKFIRSLPDVLPLRVILLPENHRAIHTEVLTEECRRTEPHPVASIHKMILLRIMHVRLQRNLYSR
jgi:hypothetical protein